MMQSRAISRIYLAGLSPMHWIAKSVVWPCLVVACHEIISKIWALTYLSLPIQSKAPVKPLYIGFRWYHLALWFWSRVLTLVPISLISLYGTTWYCESQQLENVRLIGVVTLGRLADKGFSPFLAKRHGTVLIASCACWNIRSDGVPIKGELLNRCWISMWYLKSSYLMVV